MGLKKEKMIELMNTNFNGNYNRFARELNVDPSHLYRFLKTGIGGGSKIMGAVLKYCKENNMMFEEYIQL